MKIFTKKAKFKEFNISLSKGVEEKLKKDGIDYENGDFVRKGFSSTDMKMEEGERCTIDYISTKYPDRDNEIVLPQGAILDYYNLSPICLYGHNYDKDSLPIGKTLWIKSDEKGLIAKTKYASKEANPLAEQIFNLKKEGILTSKSIGFIPVEYIEKANFKHIKASDYGLEDDHLKGVDRIYTKWILLEHSDVQIPSNVHSINLAVSKGYDEYLDNVCDGISCDLKSQAREFFSEMYDKSDAGIEKLKSINSQESDETNKTVDSNEDIEVNEKAEENIDDNSTNIEELEEKTLDTLEEKDIEGEKLQVEEIDEKSIEPSEENEKEVNNKQEQEVQEDVSEKEFMHSLCKNIKSIEIDGKKELKIKGIDITEVPSIPANFNYDVISQYLEVAVKDIFHNDYFIPGALLGNYLAGFKSIFSKYTLEDERNFYYNGSEFPVTRNIIQLNSKESDEFLTTGTQFYKTEKGGIVVEFEPTWSGGVSVGIFTSNNNKEFNKNILVDVDNWVGENNKLKGEKFSVLGTFLSESQVGFDDVYINEESKNIIKSTIEKASKDSKPRGMMFVGDPGNGKTLIGKAIVKESDNTFIWVSSDDFKKTGPIAGMSLGFEMARKLAPSTLFIEDIDTWIDEYSVDLLKTEMDGMKSNKGVTTILTSNFPERFPDALIDRPGRFHHILSFDNPDETIRKEMLSAWTNEVSEETIDKFAAITDGFSGAYLKELVEFAEIIQEDEGISYDEALIKSLKKINDQKELISNIRSGKKTKSLEENKEEKKEIEIDLESIVIPKEERKEIDIDSIQLEKKELKEENENLKKEIEKENIRKQIRELLLNKTNSEEKREEIDVESFIKEQTKEGIELAEAKITGKIVLEQ